jgi:NitT/TauT family transport system substrate-binding protein
MSVLLRLRLWVLIGIGAAGGWGGVAAAAAPVKLSVGYTNTISCAGLFIAADQGMFAKRGLDVRLLLIALNSTIPSALVGGSVQIGAATPPVLLQAVDGGLDIVAVAGGAVNDIHGQGGPIVVARPGVPIKTAKDFEGRRVGVPGIGANMHVLFRRWLTLHGADDKKVNFVEVPLAQAGDILRSGNVDAVLSNEPWSQRILQSKTGVLVAPYYTEMPDGLFAIYYAATGEWARANPASVRAFRDALQEATEFLAHDPDKSRQIVAKITRLPPDAMAAIPLPTLRATVPSSDLGFWADIMLAQGLIRSRPDPARLVIH